MERDCGKVFNTGDFSSTDLHKMQTSRNKPANELLLNGLKDYAVIQANQTHSFWQILNHYQEATFWWVSNYTMMTTVINLIKDKKMLNSWNCKYVCKRNIQQNLADQKTP